VENPEPPNPSSRLPRFTADQVETIDDHERALGLAIAHDLHTQLDQLDQEQDA
jgi:hypothetical protein